MPEITSANIHIYEKLPMRNILSLFQAIKAYKGNVYLHCGHRTIDAKNLSKLVSFLLTMNNCSDVKIIIEGQQVQSKLMELSRLFTDEQPSRKKFFRNPSETIQV
ncbi:hypothetical protein [Peribacillus kribbensis]|uniref:hypothetical protein n=1 Tax=Peribacillus kribbensis TaxID=356658 RepID=UPI000425C216|nr:hypothetical protein [Peribacillus kribbensis]